MTPTGGPGAALPALVGRLRYKPGWAFKLGGPGGQYLCVFALTADSSAPERERRTQHMFAVPPGLDDERAVARWVFDRLLLVEQHEAGEFFAIGDRRPFYPHHQDEGSPYERVERWEDP